MKYRLSELIETEKTQELLDSLCDAIGVAAAIIDLRGQVLVGSRWQRICTDFHRVNEKSAQRCIESDTQLANKLRLGEQFTFYRCKNGLTDAASPIVIEGEHVANAFVGQFLLESPDIDFFRQQAARYGFEEKSYLESLSRVPIVEKQRLPIILNFLRRFAESVATTALGRLRQLEAAERLRESEEKYRTLIETTSEGAWMLDREGKTSNVNQSLCDILGYSREEIIGKSPPYFADDENRKIFRAQMAKIKETPHRTYEITLKRKTGEDVYTHFSATTIFDESGAVQGSFALVTDISERKRAEQRIEHLNVVLRSIRNVNQLITKQKNTEKLVQGVCSNLVETRGYQNAWIVLFDESGVIWKTAEAGLGEAFLSIAELFNHGQLTRCGQWAVKQTGIVVTQDPFSTCSDCPLATSYAGRAAMTSRLEHEGKLYGFLTVSISSDFAGDEEEQLLFQEISDDIAFALHGIRLEEERKQMQQEKMLLEAQLQQAQKMEAIGTLAGGIAHDFNNILSAIMGYTEMAMDDAPMDHPIKQDLTEVLKAGIRAKDLIEQILTFSRQSETKVKPVKMRPVVKEAGQLFRASLPSTIEIVGDIQSNASVMADPTQIHQILMNLCTNAGHAMEERGGILEVSLADVELDADFRAQHPDVSPGQYVRLTVSDTGHGMDRSTMERIFEPYFTTKEKGEGTGLGLSVVHGIVASHDGAITVYSEPGEGTTFHIYLPIVEQEPEPEIRTEESLPTGSETILFVDDEAPLATLGTRLLEGLGYVVVSRTNSLEALETFRKDPSRFDVVVTDMTMPSMTGDQLATEVMKIRSDIPVILCTGFSTKISKKKAETLGIQAFVMKPFLKGEMAETVRRALDEKKGR